MKGISGRMILFIAVQLLQVVNSEAGGFTNLYSFTALSGSAFTNSDRASPYAGLLLTNNTLYGTTTTGGTGGSGTVFALTLASTPTAIPLSIQLISSKAVLSWSDPASAFSLQAAPAVTDIYTTVPGATSPYTNPITGSKWFFRLKSN